MSKSRPSGERASGEPHAAGGRYALFGEDRACPTLAPGLYIVATPIGHLSDISLRALETLAAADLIACEDTRVTSKLLGRYAITRLLLPYHEHNAAVMRPRLLAELQAGRAVALVSDAGTPLISDPGYRLVREAQAAGHTVTAIPGASAALAALVLAGLPTDRFFFEGFLPPREAARRSRIAELAAIPATLIVFETGPRLPAALADLAAGLGAREAAVCRELTKLHEEVRRDTLPALADDYAQGAETRGEFVIVIAPPQEQPGRLGEEQIDDMLRSALASASLKDAVEAVTAASGQPRRLVYQRALALAKERGDGRD
ncbi:MAG: 16S rRNA (cytidine(1402)-2'-O)-methyltransferase [Xanthobacteraceae bacterium]